MRWEQQAGQQVGDGAGSPNWALLTTQASQAAQGMGKQQQQAAEAEVATIASTPIQKDLRWDDCL